ncbi:MAG: hypothetical protein AAF441_18330 [Pseudomonadota bacterium]
MDSTHLLDDTIAFLTGLFEQEVARISAVDDTRLLIVIFAVAGILLIFRLLQRRFWLFFYFTFLSILLHELAHFVVALVTNGKPRGLSLIPEQTLNGVVLGKMLSANTRWYNGTLIALAPLLLWGLAYWFFFALVLNEARPWLLAVKIFLLASLIEGGLPSPSDFRLAAKYSLVPIAIAGATAAAVYFSQMQA